MECRRRVGSKSARKRSLEEPSEGRCHEEPTRGRESKIFVGSDSVQNNNITIVEETIEVLAGGDYNCNIGEFDSG